MYLKRLEIQGFKSFAEEVEIEFGPGITVIVGPNGCGKSNLTEAIKWVLGEQNPRALRGYKMDDVIFAGTSKRRPLGMAEVTLVFDNRTRRIPLPYEEVSITRRVYRSGESEYLINKKPCRLRNIQELLSSCGIGRAAFSVVAQGKIDEFLYVRPEERRFYLEEAAGVVKYRQRKTDALTKIEETEQALLRLEDILNELERQRLPLAEQARVANQYNFYRNSLKNLERRLIEGQIYKINRKKNALEESYQKVSVAYEEDYQRISRLELELNELAGEIKTRKKKISELEQQLLVIKNERDELNILKARSEEKLSSLLKQKSELEIRLAELSEEDKRVASESRSVEDAYNKCLQSKVYIERKYEILKKQKEDWAEKKRSVERSLKDNDTEIFDVLHRKTSVISKIHQVKNKKESIERQIENLEKKAEEEKRRMLQLSQRIAEKEKLYEKQSTALDEIVKERQLLRSRLEKLQKEKDKVTGAIIDILQKIEREKARLNILEESEKNNEGYEKGVRAILQAMASGHPSCRGIIGLVEDLLGIDTKYEKALQSALGRASHYLVCTSPEAAQNAIAYLKAHGLGRASFLPLTAVDCWMKHQSPQSVLRKEGILGRAADLVICEPRYRCISEFLLGRTYFSEDLKSARLFAESNHYKVRVVTLDGDLIQPGGLITGGKSFQGNYSFRRKKEIAELLTAISVKEESLSELRKREEQLVAEISALESKLTEVVDRCNQGELMKNVLQQEIASLKQEMKKLSDFIEGFLLKREDDGYQSVDLEQQLSQLQDELRYVLISEENLLSQKTKLESEESTCDDRLREIQKEMEELRIELVKLEQQMQNLKERKKGLLGTNKKRQENQNSIAEELKKISSDIAVLQSQGESQLRRLSELAESEAFWARELEKKRRKLASKEAFYRAKEKRYFKLKQIFLRHQQEKGNIEVQLEHLDEQLTQISAKAADLGIHIDDNPVTDELSHEEELETKKQIAEYKVKLEALGEVNLMAPSELSQLDERYNFLMQQKRDLEEGKKRLEMMIKEMDRFAASRFYKTYLEVRKYFAEIYCTLCEGGKADLILTDEKNLLTSGLDIIVMPKGKKPRHLTLLSGGEKALAGISFLFALLKTHSSPFYLLDEIEAFLDEANLSRFADLLKKIGKEHQLILISHRYQTMQVADTLYGVTMEEPGVSKVVSVKLSEWEYLNEARNTAS